MRKLTAILLLSLLLSGCASAIPTPPPDRKTPLPHSIAAPSTPGEASPTEITGAGGLPGAALAAQADLALMLGVTRNNIIIQLMQAVRFGDSCLGLGQANESCLQEPIDGYLVVLQSNGVEYAYHTSADGTVLRLVQNMPAGAGQVVEVARVILAGQLGLADAAQVQVVDALAVAWPNACLGVANPSGACAEVITPGYRILLAALGGLYEFHSNLDGTQMIQVETP